MDKKMRNTITLIVLSGSFLVSLGQNLLVSSIPILSNTFNVPEETGEWLTTTYLMVLGIISALTASLINNFSTRKLFLIFMTFFTFGCILSLFANSFAFLLTSRIIQAIGAGILMPLAQVVLLNIFPNDQKGKALGYVGITLTVAPALGPTMAGLLQDSFGWRSIFIVMLIGAIILDILAFKYLINVRETFKDRIDPVTTILYIAGFILLMVSVDEMTSITNISFVNILPIIISLLFLIGFVIRSLKIKNPILRIHLFQDRKFTLTFILISIAYLASMIGLLLIPLYVQVARGFSATISGLVMLPGALFSIFAGPIGGILLDKKGPKLVSIIGFSLLVIGNTMFCLFDQYSSLIVVSIAHLIRFFGITMAMQPLIAYAIGDLHGSEIPHGNAIIISMRQMIGSVSMSILVALASHFSLVSEAGRIDYHGINVTFTIQNIIFIIGLIISIIFIKNKTNKRKKMENLR